MADITNSFVKANNTWTQSIAWAKVDGTWRQCFSAIKANGEWQPPTSDVGLIVFPNPDPISNSYKSTNYQVFVHDGAQLQETHVYSSTRLAWVSYAIDNPPFASGSRPIMSDLTFSLSAPTIAKVKKINTTITSLDIGPYRQNINSQITLDGDGGAIFPVTPGDKLWLVINNEVSSPLFIFADYHFPSYNQVTATYPTYNHILYATGVYDISAGPDTDAGWPNRRKLNSNTVVYVSGGAYVRGHFNVSGCNDLKFMGQGCISMEQYDWWAIDIVNRTSAEIQHYACFYSTNTSTPNNYLDARVSGVEISGLTVKSFPWYFNNGVFQSIDNTKLISPWNFSTDGPRIGNFHFPQVGAKMTNAFVYNSDDVIFPAIGQAYGNFVVSNCYLNSVGGAIMVNYFPNYTNPSYSATIHKIDSRCYTPQDLGIEGVIRLMTDYTLTAFPDEPNTNYRGPINIQVSSMNIENSIEAPLFKLGNFEYLYGGGPPFGKLLGMTSGLEFIDISAFGGAIVSSNIVSGFNSTNKVTNVTFRNVNINNIKILDSNYNDFFDVTGATNKITDNINFLS